MNKKRRYYVMSRVALGLALFAPILLRDSYKWVSIFFSGFAFIQFLAFENEYNKITRRFREQ